MGSLSEAKPTGRFVFGVFGAGSECQPGILAQLI